MKGMAGYEQSRKCYGLLDIHYDSVEICGQPGRREENPAGVHRSRLNSPDRRKTKIADYKTENVTPALAWNAGSRYTLPGTQPAVLASHSRNPDRTRLNGKAALNSRPHPA